MTVAVAATPGSATDTAFTVTLDGLGRVAGAEYRPADVIVPNVELPPGTSLTNHVTRVSVAFETVAVKVCAPTPATSVTDAGDTVIETGGVMMIGVGHAGAPAADGAAVVAEFGLTTTSAVSSRPASSVTVNRTVYEPLAGATTVAVSVLPPTIPGGVAPPLTIVHA